MLIGKRPRGHRYKDHQDNKDGSQDPFTVLKHCLHVVPEIQTASGGRLRTPYCTRPMAVDARQIEPHPLDGCVSFRPLSPPPPWRCHGTMVRRRGESAMRRKAMKTEGLHVVRPRAAGLDVHKMELTATVRLCEGEGEPVVDTRCFSTLASGLEEMAAWLAGHGVEAAVMEGLSAISGRPREPDCRSGRGRAAAPLCRQEHRRDGSDPGACHPIRHRGPGGAKRDDSSSTADGGRAAARRARSVRVYETATAGAVRRPVGTVSS